MSDAEREEEKQTGTPDCASVEESRRTENELERYLPNVSDEEPMELEACASASRPTPQEACVPRGCPLLPIEAAAGPAPPNARAPSPEARYDPPRPQRVWPYEDENWDPHAEMDEPPVRPQERRIVPREQRR